MLVIRQWMGSVEQANSVDVRSKHSNIKDSLNTGVWAYQVWGDYPLKCVV